MATQGYEAGDVAWFIGVVTLPWSLKLLAAPVMDRFTYLPMGYRRPWVIAAQLGIVISFLIFALVPTELVWLAAMGAITNSFAATQDVAVDGMAIDILPATDRARANGFMFGGQYLGISMGASGGGYALNFFGIAGLGLAAAGLMMLVLLIPLLVRERPGEKLLPFSTGQPSPREALTESTWQLLRRTASVLLLPVSLLLLLSQLGGRMAEGIIIAHLPIYTVQTMGLADTAYNDFSTMGGIAAAILGVLLAPFMDRIGAHNGHWYTLTLFVAVTLIIPLTLDHWPATTIVVHWITAHLLGITLIATMMRFCHPAVAATQFAIYMAMANLNYSIGAFVYGLIQDSFASSQVLWFAALLAATAYPLWFLIVRNHVEPERPLEE